MASEVGYSEACAEATGVTTCRFALMGAPFPAPPAPALLPPAPAPPAPAPPPAPMASASVGSTASSGMISTARLMRRMLGSPVLRYSVDASKLEIGSNVRSFFRSAPRRSARRFEVRIVRQLKQMANDRFSGVRRPARGPETHLLDGCIKKTARGIAAGSVHSLNFPRRIRRNRMKGIFIAATLLGSTQ